MNFDLIHFQSSSFYFLKRRERIHALHMPPFMILFSGFWQNRNTFRKIDGCIHLPIRKNNYFTVHTDTKWAINTKLTIKRYRGLAVLARVHSSNDEFAWNRTPHWPNLIDQIFMIHKLQLYSDRWYQILWFLSIYMSACVRISSLFFGDEVTDFQNICSLAN